MAEGNSRTCFDSDIKLRSRRKKSTPDERKDIAPLENVSAGGESFPETSNEKLTIPDCPICLQTCVYPARLPCSHIFCFLCLKGIASQSRRCAMCRQDIPLDYLEHPDLMVVQNNKCTKLTSSSSVIESASCDNNVTDKLSKDNCDSNLEAGYQWFYEGRNGWWQYDERTSAELESSYKQGNRNCELLIAGFLYMADFDSMIQVRKNESSRVRRIKRDLATIPKKGIAGIRSFALNCDNNVSVDRTGSNSLTISTIVEQMSNLSISSTVLQTRNDNENNRNSMQFSAVISTNTNSNNVSGS